MSTEVDVQYKPLTIHKPFHASKARYKLALGGYGSGKSVALCWEAIMFALEQPGSDMIIARRYAPSLRDSTEAIFFDCLPKVLLDLAKAANPNCIVRLGGHVSSFQFHNGTLLKFKGIEDWKKEKSQNVSWLGFDEADEQQEGTVVGMASRLRQTQPLKAAAERGYSTPMPMRRQCCLASNPEGKNWHWKRFFNPTTKWDDAEGFISTTLDNPHLPLDFVADQMSKGIAYVKRYVLCMFDEQAGAIYPDWGPGHRVALAPVPGDAPMELWQTMDPGSTNINPTAAVWWAVDRRRGRLVAVAEYQEHNIPAAQHAKNWKRVEAGLLARGYGKVVWRSADPVAIATHDRGSNTTLSDIYRRLGFSFVPGPVRHAVRVPALGEMVSGATIAVTEKCPLLYGQIENYRWEDQLPQHIDLGAYREKVRKGNDHLVDCAQYAAARWVVRVGAPAAEEEKSEMQHFEAEVRASIRAALTKPRGLPDGVAA